MREIVLSFPRRSDHVFVRQQNYFDCQAFIVFHKTTSPIKFFYFGGILLPPRKGCPFRVFRCLYVRAVIIFLARAGRACAFLFTRFLLLAKFSRTLSLTRFCARLFFALAFGCRLGCRFAYALALAFDCRAVLRRLATLVCRRLTRNDSKGKGKGCEHCDNSFSFLHTLPPRFPYDINIITLFFKKINTKYCSLYLNF